MPSGKVPPTSRGLPISDKCFGKCPDTFVYIFFHSFLPSVNQMTSCTCQTNLWRQNLSEACQSGARTGAWRHRVFWLTAEKIDSFPHCFWHKQDLKIGLWDHSTPVIGLESGRINREGHCGLKWRAKQLMWPEDNLRTRGMFSHVT